MISGPLQNLLALFRPLTVDEMRARLAADAQRQALEHETAAEHHAALAAMFTKRHARLTEKPNEPR